MFELVVFSPKLAVCFRFCFRWFRSTIYKEENLKKCQTVKSSRDTGQGSKESTCTADEDLFPGRRGQD